MTKRTSKRHDHGGKREGAGRTGHTESRVIGLRYSAEDLEELEAQRLEDETLAMTAKRLIRWQLEQRKETPMYTTITDARQAIKNSGLSAQSGYAWNVDGNTYQALEDAATNALYRGLYADPETALIQEAIRLGIATATDF